MLYMIINLNLNLNLSEDLEEWMCQGRDPAQCTWCSYTHTDFCTAECSWWTGPEEPCYRVAQDPGGSGPGGGAAGRPDLCRVRPEERWLSGRVLIRYSSPPCHFFPVELTITRPCPASQQRRKKKEKCTQHWNLGQSRDYQTPSGEDDESAFFTLHLHQQAFSSFKPNLFCSKCWEISDGLCRNKLFFFVFINLFSIYFVLFLFFPPILINIYQ